MSIQNQHKQEYKETTVLVAEIKGRVQAYTVAWLVGDELQVIDLAVDKFWRRQGLARLLMDRLIKMWCEPAEFVWPLSSPLPFIVYNRRKARHHERHCVHVAPTIRHSACRVRLQSPGILDGCHRLLKCAHQG